MRFCCGINCITLVNFAFCTFESYVLRYEGITRLLHWSYSFPYPWPFRSLTYWEPHEGHSVNTCLGHITFRCGVTRSKLVNFSSESSCCFICCILRPSLVVCIGDNTFPCPCSGSLANWGSCEGHSVNTCLDHMRFVP